MPYKYKLTEMSKTASPEEAEKELGIPQRKFEVGQVTYADNGLTKSEIYDIDDVTGTVSWKVTQLPGFDKLFDEVNEFVEVAKRVYQKTKDDKKFREIYDDARKVKNKIRTHLRNEYPEDYKRMAGRIDEEEVDEMSTSGGAGAYLTPYAFRKKGKKPNIKAYKEIGYKEVKEAMDGGQLFDYFAKKGYKVTERRPDGREAGFDGYMVSIGNERAPQSVIFQYDKDVDQFMISRIGGYRIDQEEAMKAGMRQAAQSGVVGRDAYITDGNYTPVDISVEGLKDIVDHVMTGLDRERKAQADFYAARGRTSGTIDEELQLVHVYDKDGKMYGTGSVEKVEGDKTTVRFDGSTVKRFPSDRVKPVKETYIVTGKKGKGEAQYGEPYGTEKEARAAMEKILKSIKDIGEKPDAKFGVRKGPLEENDNPGATLGPGPKAGPDGVKDNYYVKGFKYKLVPKKIKNSGIITKKLF